ncbi:hypothetical protein [Mycoplasmopsis edwardii]|uniref:Uncharacterized protein n=1 Tax=Mycoplasmopsis edwardii TaxID=53558 RepID=A0ACD4PJ48_9BACT|nr:hypothetical protein [Mycoplasmopsis edwardii]WBP84370.1 hypothetical protein Me_995_000353 [Mycoplasmopsis edwardii]
MDKNIKKSQILKLYLKFQFTQKRLYIISLALILVFFTSSLISYLVEHNNQSYKLINSFALASLVTFLISLTIFGLKIGILSRTINKIKNGSPEYREKREKKKLNSMSEAEKRIYLETKKRDHEFKESFPNKTVFPYFLNFLISFLVFIIFIIVSYV